jgi:hypothetical protein
MILLVSLAAPGLLKAQCDDSPAPDGLTWEYDPPTEPFSVVGFLRDALTPQVITETRFIRSYVRDEQFRVMMDRCGEMRAVDAIYLKALRITEYEISRALFLSLMAVLEHRNVEFELPFGGSLAVPLTFEADSLFRARYRHLPSRIYPDTPPEGDRDKLQHFFASAYIAFVSDSPTLARASGNAVEWGEARFIVGGADDPRDRRSNKHGEWFGRDLLTVKTLLPSDYLTMPDSRQGTEK